MCHLVRESETLSICGDLQYIIFSPSPAVVLPIKGRKHKVDPLLSRHLQYFTAIVRGLTSNENQ